MLAGGMIYVCLPLMFGRTAPGAFNVAKWMYRSEPWNMVEVFLLGVLVSLLKLAKVADVHFGIGILGIRRGDAVHGRRGGRHRPRGTLGPPGGGRG
jgi:uncharacterized paraquat-inducible protein A